MEQQPLLSVIVPVYNAGQYLSQCLDSIIGQTYKNLEIILVNDGSTDGSGAICDEYAHRDGRIRVIHKANGGQGMARNRGLSVATGDYVSFIDSDDWIDLSMYDSAISIFACSPHLAIVRYGVRRCWQDGKESFERLNTEEVIRIQGEKIISSYGNEGCDGIMCSSVYRMEIFKESGLSYPEGIVHEDEALSLSISCFLAQKKESQVYICSDIMYNYRMVAGSTVSKLANRHVTGVCKGIDFVRSYTKEYSKDLQQLILLQIGRMLRYYIPHWLVAGIDRSEIEGQTKSLRKLVLHSLDNLSTLERLFYRYPYFYTQASLFLQRLRRIR